MFDKTLEDIQKETEKRLVEEGFSVSKGSIVKLFISIVNKEISNFYELLKEAHSNAFISTAKGEYLDAIGMIINCIRNENEEDVDYRGRISKHVNSIATSNEVSIRTAALSVEGVKDILLKKYSHGAGSFSLIVSTGEYETSDNIVRSVRNAIDEVVAFGCKFIVDKPKNDYIKLSIKLLIKESNEMEQHDVKLQVKQNILNYINSLKIGEGLIVNELTERIMATDTSIVNYICESIEINGKLEKFINQECSWTTRFLVSPEAEAIKVY